MWKLSASISGDLLVPSWEGSSALQWSFQHKHAEGCCVPSSMRERKPWSRFLGHQWWPIDCGTGTEPTFQPFIAQAHKISGERVVWYGTWFLFPVLLGNLNQSFALGAIPCPFSVCQFSLWQQFHGLLNLARVKLFPKEVALPSLAAYSCAASFPPLLLAHTPMSTLATRTAEQAWIYRVVWMYQGTAIHAVHISRVLLWASCVLVPQTRCPWMNIRQWLDCFRCAPFFRFCFTPKQLSSFVPKSLCNVNHSTVKRNNL